MLRRKPPPSCGIGPPTIAVIMALGLAASAAGAEEVVTIDGDSFRLDGEIVRIFGYDAPEGLHPRCETERMSGYAAQEALRRILAGSRLTVERRGKDRHGRTLARVLANGRDIAELMISAGHGVAYVCPNNADCPDRMDWCAWPGKSSLP
jgi:micrococcal nuclease